MKFFSSYSAFVDIYFQMCYSFLLNSYPYLLNHPYDLFACPHWKTLPLICSPHPFSSLRNELEWKISHLSSIWICLDSFSQRFAMIYFSMHWMAFLSSQNLTFLQISFITLKDLFLQNQMACLSFQSLIPFSNWISFVTYLR